MRQANPIKSRLPAIFTDLLLVSLLPLWHIGSSDYIRFYEEINIMLYLIASGILCRVFPFLINNIKPASFINEV